jgi:hypothetical protein
MIENDIVVLTVDVPEHGLKAGDIGTVLKNREDGKYDIEFTALNGTKIVVITMAATHVRPVEGNEISHVRVIGAA